MISRALVEQFMNNNDPKELFKLKQLVLTNSMNEFKKRHNWFKFRKDDLYKNFPKASVPKILQNLAKGANAEMVKKIIRENEIVVLKTIYGHSGKQVYLLRANKDGSFDDLLHRTILTIAEIQTILDYNESIIEESLHSSLEIVPLDFKCYISDGQVVFIAVINRNAIRPIISYFDGQDFNHVPLTEIFPDPPSIWISGLKPYPLHLYDRMAIAKSFALEFIRDYLNIAGLFLSLDIYVVWNGVAWVPYIGEITPRPGAVFHNYTKRDFTMKMFGIRTLQPESV